MSTLQTVLFSAPSGVRPSPRGPQIPLEAVAHAPAAALDVETDGADPRRARLTHVAWATAGGSGVLRAPDAAALRTLAHVAARTALVFQNGIYDLIVLARSGCDLLALQPEDTRVMSVLLDETGTHTLQSLARRYLRATDVFSLPEVLAGSDPAQADHLLGLKARVDCERTLELRDALWARVLQQPPVTRAYCDVERPLVGVLAQLSLVGLPVDRAVLRRTIESAIAARVPAPTLGRVVRWEQELDAGGRFHPLYSAWSDPCGAIKMQDVRADRSLSLLTMLTPPTGAVLTMLTPPTGAVLLRLTFPQLALRWMATLAACGPVLEAFRTGAPVGTHLSDTWGAGGPPGEVIEAWLQALASGVGPRTVMRATGLRLREVRAARKALLDRLAGLRRWLLDMETTGARRGWLQAPSGRRRHFKPRYTARRAAADLIELCCHDVVKRMLLRLSSTLPRGTVVGAHRMTLYLEAAAGEADAITEYCREVATDVARGLMCPIEVEVAPVAGSGGGS